MVTIKNLFRFIMVCNLAVALAIVGATTAIARDAVKVVVSIAPLHSLAAALLEAVAVKPHLLVRGGDSPHTYSLRPSDAKVLQEADLVFWVGGDLEPFLIKLLKNRRENSRIVSMLQVPGLHVLPNRSGHDEPQATSHHNDHHFGGDDMHIWLDPNNAKAMVAAMAKALIAVDPKNISKYQERKELLFERLDLLDQKINQALAPIKNIPFMVFHDSFQYFEKHYNLKSAIALTPSPEQRLGARRMREVRQLLQDGQISCLFQEPQFNPNVVEVLLAGSGAKKGVLDPLGSSFEPGPNHYFSTMQAIADSLEQCLTSFIMSKP